jgi:formylglycine-generating enzyme required for sulfatase activity
VINNLKNIYRRNLTISFLAIFWTSIVPQLSTAATAVPEDMVLVNAGGFTRGIDNTKTENFLDEAPAKMIYLSTYYIDKFEVSNSKYTEFIIATDHPAPAYWDHRKLNQPSQPVTGVNWFDSDTYCRWANKRLPTEAEWEKAARGPAGSIYPWGNELDYSKANFAKGKTGKKYITSPVDAHPKGVSYYGAYNMAGNVFEWVQDWYSSDYYKLDETRNPKGPQLKETKSIKNISTKSNVLFEKKVIRGGSWFAPAQSITTTHRFWNNPINNSYGVGLGFRCARDLSENLQTEARTFYMNALILVGDEKYKKALSSIKNALINSPKNKEYKALKLLIQKQLNP